MPSAEIKKTTNFAVLLPTVNGGGSCAPLGKRVFLFGNLSPQFEKGPGADARGLRFVGGSHAYNR